MNKHGYKQCPICHEALREYNYKGTDIWQCTMCVFAGCNVFTTKDLTNFEEKLQEIEFANIQNNDRPTTS
jgi:ribosomal protein L37AE/L43A